MKGYIHIHETNTIEATMQLTMTIKEWKDFRDAIKETYEGLKVSRLIDNLVSQIENEYFKDIKV